VLSSHANGGCKEVHGCHNSRIWRVMKYVVDSAEFYVLYCDVC